MKIKRTNGRTGLELIILSSIKLPTSNDYRLTKIKKRYTILEKKLRNAISGCFLGLV